MSTAIFRDAPPFEFCIAKILALPTVADAIIRQAQKTPYHHLDGYMERWWSFNPWEDSPEGQPLPLKGWRARVKSGRVHHILRRDNDRHFHDHPWDARTFILKGWYVEERLIGNKVVTVRRKAGDTAPVLFGQFHRIVEVSPGGVWTLFVMDRYRGEWGFLVDGKKIPAHQYLKPQNTAAA